MILILLLLIIIIINNTNNTIKYFEGVCLSNYCHLGSSAHGVGSARRVCYVASASAGSTGGKLQIDGLVPLSRPKIAPKLFKIRD